MNLVKSTPEIEDNELFCQTKTGLGCDNGVSEGKHGSKYEKCKEITAKIKKAKPVDVIKDYNKKLKKLTIKQYTDSKDPNKKKKFIMGGMSGNTIKHYIPRYEGEWDTVTNKYKSTANPTVFRSKRR